MPFSTLQKPPNDALALRAAETLNNPVFVVFMLVLTLWTLFVEDIRIALAPPGTKEYFYGATSVCLAFFLAEMLLQGLADPSYYGLHFRGGVKHRPDDFCDCSGCLNFFLPPVGHGKKEHEDEEEESGSPTPFTPQSPIAAAAKAPTFARPAKPKRRHFRLFYCCFLGSFWFWIDFLSSLSLCFEIYRIVINTYPCKFSPC
jgi:hypothetical protein